MYVAIGREGYLQGLPRKSRFPHQSRHFVVAQADRRDGRIPPFNDCSNPS